MAAIPDVLAVPLWLVLVVVVLGLVAVYLAFMAAARYQRECQSHEWTLQALGDAAALGAVAYDTGLAEGKRLQAIHIAGTPVLVPVVREEVLDAH
jgi:hypothetical protein